MATAVADTAEAIVVEMLRTPAGRSDPYPLYHRLREIAPVYRSDDARGWLLTAYDDAKAALRDPRLEKRFEEMLDANSTRWRERASLIWGSKTLLNLDPPIHTRLRRRVFKSFTRGSVEALRPRVEERADELLADFARTDGADLMERIAFPLPIMVIGELLGVPNEDLPAFRERTLRLTGSLELRPTREMLDAADDAVVESTEYFNDLVARKRTSPGDDLISQLVAPDEDPLTDEEIANLAILLFVAGFETTTSLIGNAILAFLEQPDQLQALRDDPSLCKNLPQELLRHGGTVQLVSRYAVEDVPIGDQVIPAGDSVFPMLGAANRDPARYDDPDRIDVRRQKIAPLAFGGGIHHCLGAALAELEIEVLFSRIAERFDVSALSDARVPHRDRLSLHTPSEVAIRLDARTAGEDVPVRPTGDDSAWRAAFRAKAEANADALPPETLADRVAVLERIPLFAACTAAELALLAATAYTIAFDEGDVLIRAGAAPTDAYVVTEGEASVQIDGEVVATVGTDEVVGERGPIEDRPRSATVTASTNMITFAIAQERLRGVLDANPDAARHMKALVAARYG